MDCLNTWSAQVIEFILQIDLQASVNLYQFYSFRNVNVSMTELISCIIITASRKMNKNDELVVACYPDRKVCEMDISGNLYA